MKPRAASFDGPAGSVHARFSVDSPRRAGAEAGNIVLTVVDEIGRSASITLEPETRRALAEYIS